MNKYESVSATVIFAFSAVVATALMSVFVDWAYSEVGIPEQGVIALVDAAKGDSELGQNVVCARPATLARAEPRAR